MSVGPVEAVWLLLTISGSVITLWALLDARRDRDAIAHLNGDVRSIAVKGNVRREWVRFLIQVVLMSLVLPSLFSDAEVRLTWFTAALMSLPALQLVNTGSDYIDRRRIARKLTAEMAR